MLNLKENAAGMLAINSTMLAPRKMSVEGEAWPCYLFVVSLSEARKKIYSKCCTYFCFALNNCVCAHVDLNCGYFSISVAFSIAAVLIAMLSF